jgi:hypothetical protein
MLLEFRQPIILYLLLRERIGGINHKNGCICVAIVGLDNGSEALLTCGVPQLHLDEVAIQIERPESASDT